MFKAATFGVSGLAPLRWRGICSVGRLSLELGGAEVVERRVIIPRFGGHAGLAGHALLGLLGG